MLLHMLRHEKLLNKQHGDAQYDDVQHNDVQNDDFQQQYALRMMIFSNLMVFRFRNHWGDPRDSKLPSKVVDYVMLLDVGEPSCYNVAIYIHDHAKWK